VFTYTAFCNIQIWLFLLGYDLVMGSLLAKNIRLLYIFYYALRLKKVKPIQTWHLLAAIMIVIVLDAIVIVVYEAAFPIKTFMNEIDVSNPSLDYPLCGSTSGSDNVQKGFIATLGALKAILLLVSLFIIYAVRKQPSEFNEAKAIAFSVYNQAFCIVALLAVWLVIPDSNYEIKYILRSIIVLWGAIMTVFFIFFKKFYYIAIGKDKAFKNRGSNSTTAYNTRESSSRKDTGSTS